jgi:hypothetical protein
VGHQSSDLLIDLLAEMAKALGFDFDKVELRKGVYAPRAHAQLEDEQLLLRKYVLELMEGKRAMRTGIFTGKYPVQMQIAQTPQPQQAQPAGQAQPLEPQLQEHHEPPAPTVSAETVPATTEAKQGAVGRRESVLDDQYRKFLEQCETEASTAFDKTTVTLSGGALALSLAFVKDIAPNAPTWAKLLLLLPSWLALALSLLGVLLSLMASMKSMRHEIECIDGRRVKADGEKPGGAWRDWTETFNDVAITGCITGIALFVIYVFVSVWSTQP